MKSNERFLQEAFFKKTTYQDKLNKKLPAYTPYGDPKSPASASFAISDASELRRRLTSGLGVSFANNSIKAMSNKAIKTFPIIVSDTLEPETIVMLKRYLEEQYADYINLMISNKVIDIADFKTGQDNGNIAIQAIDSISGPDFSSDRVARKARDTGSVGISDFLTNVPIYNLLRQESCNITCGNDLVDTLLEGAMIVPSENVADLIQIITEFEKPTPREEDANGKATGREPLDVSKKYEYLNKEKVDKDGNTARKRELIQRSELDKKSSGYDDGETLAGLTSARATVLGVAGKNGRVLGATSRLEKIMDRTTADIIYAPGNEHIRDRFEKASVLLVSRKISGQEYCNYLRTRLGVPVSGSIAAQICSVYRASDVQYRTSENLNKVQVKWINKSLDDTSPEYFKAMNKIGRSTLGFILGASAGAGVGTYAGIKLLNHAKDNVTLKPQDPPTQPDKPQQPDEPIQPENNPILLAVAQAPIWAVPLAGALAGTGLAIAIRAFIKARLKAKKKKENLLKTEGWERVEKLIDDMDQNWRELKLKVTGSTHNINKQPQKKDDDKTVKDEKDEETISKKEYDDAIRKMKEFKDKLEKALKQGKPINESEYSITDGFILTESEWNETIELIREGFNDDPELKRLMEAELLDETLLSEKPITIDDYLGKVKSKQIVYDPKEMMVTPAYSARSQYAYGSAEYDRREAKDRKYNAPLIMTIRFKERLDDGKFADNEMTAVIGILGVVIRVPSDEMKTILKSNAEGNTLKGFLGSSTIGNTIADLLSTTKLKSDVEKLPISADVWHNMEKIGHLALANKLGGKQAHNISNAHIIFSQKEIDDLRNETGIDYIKDKKLAEQLLKRYAAFSVMIANDPSERVYVFDDPDNISWNVIPYSAIRNRDSSDQLTSALIRASQGRL